MKDFNNITVNLIHTGHYLVSKELCVGYGNPLYGFAFWAISEWCNSYSGAEHKIYNHRIYSKVRFMDIHYLIPFASEKSLRNVIKELAEDGVIDVQNLNEDKRDHTLWYSVSGAYL